MSPSCLNMSIAHSPQDKVKTPCGWKAPLWFDPGRPPALVILSAPSPHHTQRHNHTRCSALRFSMLSCDSGWNMIFFPPGAFFLPCCSWLDPMHTLSLSLNVTSDSCSRNTQSKLVSLMDFLIIPHVFLNSNITHMCLCVHSIKNGFPQ